MLNGTESPERRTMERKAWKIQLRERLLKFSISVITLANQLPKSAAGFAIANQVIRSGTSIGANIREAQNAQSKSDFIHKLSISQKECDETMYWLELLNQSGYLSDTEFKLVHNNANELLKMLRSAIITSKNNRVEEQQVIYKKEVISDEL